ncbi:MAG: BatA domain-containing protein [Planctomycetota bacterium]|nr:BatA domain-containing protein [Planctomycetota bacterium]MDA1138885.1 BatA domain-containing protein [Planctomycetota bacterium]
MSFVSQLFLAGLLATSIPVIIHLLFRRQKRQVLFSTLRFLKKVTEEKARRLRIKEWLLLALRIAIVALIAFAFSRPFLKDEKQAQEARTDLVILFDDSYSMATIEEGESRLYKAKARARDLLDELKPADRAAIVTTSKGGNVVQPLSSDIELTAASLSDLKSVNHFCRYWPAVKRAHALLAASDGQKKRLVFITDGQLTSWEGMSEVRTLEGIGKTISLEAALVGEPSTANLAVLDARLPSKIWSGDEPVKISVKVANYSRRPVVGAKLSFSLNRWPETSEEASAKLTEVATKNFSLDPNEVGTVTLKAPLPRKDNILGQITIESQDGLQIDNSYYFSVSAEDAIRVLCVEDWEAPKPFLQATYYLQRALVPKLETEKASAGYIQVKLITREMLESVDLRKFQVVVLANVSAFPPTAVDRLDAFVRNGGGLIVFAGDQLDPEFYNQHGFKEGRGWMPAKLAAKAGDDNRREDFWTLVPREKRHELFLPYSGDSLTELSSARFFRYQSVEPAEDADVIAVFDNDAPAFIERKVGEGRSLLITTSCNADWTDFPKRGTFLPMAHQMIRYLSPRDRTSRSLLSLEEDLGQTFGGSRSYKELETLSAVGPEGVRVKVTDPMTRPGLYHVLNQDGNVVTRSIAVNLNTRESNPARVDMSEIASLGVSPQAEQQAIEASGRALWEERGRASNWWRHLLLAVLGLMMVELAVANSRT